MEKFIIEIHSFVDVITNSSTELFICDTDRAVAEVAALVAEIEKRYPNEYGHGLSVDHANDYELQDVFGYMEEEDAVKFLKAKGYTVEKPKEDSTPKYISISAERGGLDTRVKDFIEEAFNVIHYSSEA